jgi:hypothetical protein
MKDLRPLVAEWKKGRDKRHDYVEEKNVEDGEGRDEG